MRFITFKTLEAKNFLSIGDKLVSIDLRPGVNAITGINLDKEDSKNGAGKSTITEILYYSLFGSTLREISKDFIQNSITQKRCEVSLTFDVVTNNLADSYKITRELNPTKCFLFKNGEDITRSTLAKTNNLIQDIIRTPSTVFQNSVIMSSNNALPFMALPKTDKRKFVESILGLEVFTSMILKARDEFNTAKRDYEIEYSSLEQLESQLTFNNTQLSNHETVKDAKVAKLKEKIKSVIEEIHNLEQQFVKDLPSDLDQHEQIIDVTRKIEEIQVKQTSHQSKIHKAEAEINSLTKQIQKFLTNKDQCPTCSRNYDKTHVEHVSHTISTLESSKSLYQQACDKISKELTSLRQTIKTLNQEKQQLELEVKTNHQINSNNASLLSRVKLLKDNKVEAEEEIKYVLSEQNNDLKGRITTLEESKAKSQQNVDDLNNKLNILESVKFVLSEEGIKSYITKKIKTVLNQQIAVYLKKLEANCLCRFDEFFEEEIIDEKGCKKSYFNFSGGERKRIDLACLFAFADVRRLQGDANFSTIFYDELLDSSLDDRGILLCLQILQDRFAELHESCYIVTHRGLLGDLKPFHTIQVVKKNGITSLSK